MNTIQKKQLSVLNETIKHFNSTNRSVDDGNCVYSPTTKSEGCGVGRLIDNKELCKRFDNADSMVSMVFYELPLKVKELGCAFLSDLQKLHDCSHNWDEKGLSDRGKTKVNDLKKRIKLGTLD